MNYQVIARRYRPRRFEEVVGQESAAETLRGAILQERTAHAYLFSGPRGVGKTSMARIFAKALNCPIAADRTGDSSTWGMPCDDCPTCAAIHLGQDIDVVEMDGASHRGIEDVRSIIEGVSRPATRSIYKIYLIDEVHMLTREAFNALLKTLEEPPAHVKFIFATTEAHRIPDTVLSRCQRFEFHPIGSEAIVRRLEQILEQEGRQAEDGLLGRVATYGRGGLRDAQTILDQLMTFEDDILHQESLDRITGRLPDTVVKELAEACLRRDPSRVLESLRQAFTGGADPGMVLEQVMDILRNRMRDLVRSGDAGGASDEASGGPSLDRVVGSLQILLETSSQLRHSTAPDLAVELTLLKVARLEELVDLEEVLRRLREMPEGTGVPPAVSPGSPAVSPGSPNAAPLPGGAAGPLPGGAAGPLPGGATGLGTAAPAPSGDRGDRAPVQPARAAGVDSPPPSGPPGGAAAALAAARAQALEARPRGGGGAAPAPVLREPDGNEPTLASAAASTPSESGVAQMGAPPTATSSVPVAVVGAEGAVADGAPPVATETGERIYDFREFLQVWDHVRVELESRHPELASFFHEVVPSQAEERDTLLLEFPNEFFTRQMSSPRRRQAVETVVEDVTRTPWKLRFDHRREVAAAPGAADVPLPAAPDPATPDPASMRQAPTLASGPASVPPAQARELDPQAAGKSTLDPSARQPSETSPTGSDPSGRGVPGPDPTLRTGDIAKDPLVKKSLDLFNGRIV